MNETTDFSPLIMTTTVVKTGGYSTTNKGASIYVKEVDTDSTVRLLVKDQYFDAHDLREAAALFTKMADALDAN